MNDIDYYKILGVERNASESEIKSAYRKLALKHHPDRNPDDPAAEEMFKQAAEAYSVLGDAQKRQRFDQYGAAGLSGGAQGFDPSMFQDIFGSMGFGGGGLEDLFSQMFGGNAGGGRSQTRAQRGHDLRYQLEIEFVEAARGTEVKIKVPRSETCPGCSGSGARPGGKVSCESCHGRGRVNYRHGFMQVARTCPQCNGSGEQVVDPCKDCGGDGRIATERTVTVRVPAGIDDGMRLRVAGEGDGGWRGGPPGDLYVDIALKPHEKWVRDDADVHAELVLGFPDLVLGGRFEVETLHGTQDVEVPAGTHPATVLRLAGQGMARVSRRGRGDHLVHVVARPPGRPDEKEKALWRSLRELQERGGGVDGHLGQPEGDRSFFDKLRDFLRA